MKDKLVIVGNILTYLLTVIETNEIFQLISLILSVAVSVIIILFKLYSWYKQAKKDGKITKDEVKDLTEDIKPEIDIIKDNIDKDSSRKK